MSGVNLAATAVLGRIFLGERVSRRTIFAIGLLFTSIILLCLAAPKASKVIRTDDQCGQFRSGESTEGVPGQNAAVCRKKTPDRHGHGPVDRRRRKPRPAGNGRRWPSVRRARLGLSTPFSVVVIRRNVTTDTPTTAVVFIVTAMGVVSFGPLAGGRRGPDLLAHVPLSYLGLMLFSGVLNLLSFLAITKGLQWMAAARPTRS